MSESGEKQDKEKRRFSQEQYEMLLRCSEKKDMTEWNTWREKNDYINVELEGGDFSNWHLEGANLRDAYLTGPESFVSEWKDFTTVFKMMQFRLFTENPKLLDTIMDIQRMNPIK